MEDTQLTEDRVREIYEKEQTRSSLIRQIATYPEIIIYIAHKMKNDGTHSPEELLALEFYAKIAQEVIDARPSLFKTIKRWFK